MNYLILIASLVFGLIIGSFLNVVIFRLRKKESLLFKRSYCPRCKKKLKVWELIPVLSFLILKGRCSHCHRKIAWQYPLVELATALAFATVYLRFGFSLKTGYLIVLAGFLILIFVFDLKYYLIPDWFVWPAIILALLGSYFVMHLSIYNLLWGILISGGFFLCLLLITKGKGMGMGDVKLGILVGSILAFPQIILVLFLAFILGGITGGILLLTKKKKRTDLIPFAPFLVLATFLILLWEPAIKNWF